MPDACGFDAPELAPLMAPLLARLTPTGQRLLAAARDYALSIHADEVGPEHLLCALMTDEECAAHRAVEHAFADPETIAAETLALASGILVSGSVASLPFSPGGVLALERARALAAERRDGAVREAHLLVAAVGALPGEAGEELAAAGWSSSGALELGSGDGAVPVEGPLFRQFTDDAKRALSAAARTARQDRATSIGPAHLVLACLGAGTELPRAAGLSASRARSILRGRTHDESPPAPRAIAPDDALVGFLEGLEPGSGSLELLRRFHGGASAELAQLLARHRVSVALVDRVQPAFRD